MVWNGIVLRPSLFSNDRGISTPASASGMENQNAARSAAGKPSALTLKQSNNAAYFSARKVYAEKSRVAYLDAWRHSSLSWLPVFSMYSVSDNFSSMSYSIDITSSLPIKSAADTGFPSFDLPIILLLPKINTSF